MPHVEFSDDQARPGKSRRRYSLERFIERISEGAFALCRNLTQFLSRTHHDDSLMRFCLDKITRRLGQTRVIVQRERFAHCNSSKDHGYSSERPNRAELYRALARDTSTRFDL